MIGLFLPETLGLGTSFIRNLIDNPVNLNYVIFLLIGKTFLTIICIRLNLFGGIFSPALFLGATTGCIFVTIAQYFFPDLNYSLFAVAGMAAVTSCVIGGPISTLLIVFELTSDYQVALGAGISVCFANLISSKIYGHSAFDQILLNRKIDIKLGRNNLHLKSISIEKILSTDYIRLAPEHKVEDMIKILSKAGSSEGYIINPKGKLLGKVELPNLVLNANKTIPPDASSYSNFLTINSKNNVLEAIQLIKDFVGESVPIIDENKNILGIVTESDLFTELLKAEKVREDEELAD